MHIAPSLKAWYSPRVPAMCVMSPESFGPTLYKRVTYSARYALGVSQGKTNQAATHLRQQVQNSAPHGRAGRTYPTDHSLNGRFCF